MSASLPEPGGRQPAVPPPPPPPAPPPLPPDGVAIPPGPPTVTPETPAEPAGPRPALVVPKTATSATWVAVGAGLFILLLVIIFIGQNQHDARLNFLWIHGNVPVGLTILLAFVLGALVVLLLGVVRLTQLRLMARRHRQSDRAAPPAV